MRKGFRAVMRSAGPAAAAVAIAIAGTAVAAATIDGSDIKANSIKSKQIKNHSLLKKDFKSGQLPRGKRGPRGFQGVKGDRGAPGAPGTNTIKYVRTQVGTGVPTGATVSGAAQCPTGMHPTGGGADSNGTGDLFLRESRPEPGVGAATGWHVSAKVEAGGPSNVFAFAVCVNSTNVTGP
jgi:hypothetical protein